MHLVGEREEKEMGAAKRGSIPAFGNWNSFDGIPISKCFESTTPVSVCPIYRQYFRQYVSGDLLLAPLPTPVNPGRRIKRRERRRFNEKKRQRRVHDAKEEEQFSPQIQEIRSAKAVDEDLYKIPPEFLYQKPKLKSLIRSMWTWCMGMRC